MTACWASNRWPGHSGAAIALCLLVWGVPALAYRPFDSTDASVVKPLQLELELGPVGYLAQGRLHFFAAPNLVLNFGIVSGWEVVLEGRQLIELGQTLGGPRLVLDETALQLKGVLRDGCLQEKEGPSVAVEASILLPTVHAEPGMGAALTVIVSERVGTATLSFNGTVALARSSNLLLGAGLIVEGPFHWTVRPVAELLVEQELNVGTTVSALAGAIWNLSEDFSLDLALRAGRDPAGSLVEVRAGFTWTLPL